MAKEQLLFGFKDIVEPRRFNKDAVAFMSRHWDPQPAYKASKIITPNEIKKLAFESKRLDNILNDVSYIYNIFIFLNEICTEYVTLTSYIVSNTFP